MYFVVSWWYLAIALLFVGIVAMTIVYFMMDKKDKLIIKEFVDSSSSSIKTKPEDKKVEKLSE